MTTLTANKYRQNKIQMKMTAIIIAMSLLVSLTSITLTYLIRSTQQMNNMFVAATKYTLIYNENSSDPVSNMPNPAEVSQYNNEFIISEAVPSRSGHVFTGWNTKKDGTGESYNPSTSTSEVELRATSRQVILYAQWESNKYSLIYNANGGTIVNGKDESEDTTSSTYIFTIKSNEELGLSHSDPNKVFMGWAETAQASEAIYGYQGKGYRDNGTGVAQEVTDLQSTLTANSSKKEREVYAVWGTRYTLSFSENPKYHGVGPVPQTQSVVGTGTKHRFYLPPESVGPVPTRVGYEFQWWSYGEDRKEGETHFKFGEYIDLKDDNPSVTLYARYYPRDGASVYYDGNAPVTVSNLPKQNPDQAVIPADAPNYPYWIFDLPANVPTATGRHFLGWSTDKNAETPEYLPGDEFKVNVDEAKDVTLYAVWYPPHKFSITLHANAEDAWISWVSKSASSFWQSTSTNEKAADNSWARIISADYNAETKKCVIPKGYIGATADYSGKPNYRLAGFSSKPGATQLSDIDYPINSYGYIDREFTITCEKDPCPGKDEIHNIDLYAVWVPLHSMAIKFYVNDPHSNSDLNSIMSITYRNSAAGTVENNTSEGSRVYRFITQDASNTTFVLKKDLINNLQVSDSHQYDYHDFLGWSTNPNADKPDKEFEVINYTSDQYRFVNDIEFTVDPNDVEPGKLHIVKELYAVYENNHRYGIRFNINKKAGAGVESITSSWNSMYAFADWNYDVSSPAGRVYYSEPTSYKNKTYTIPAGSTGVYFTDVRGGKFLGWASSEENAENKIVDPDFALDSEGRFINSVTFNDPDANCQGEYTVNPTIGKKTKIHIVKELWAVWNYQHYFSIELNRNATSGSITASKVPGGRGNSYVNGNVIVYGEDVDVTETAYTINAKTISAVASGRTGYKFLGWSPDKNATEPHPDYLIDEEGKFIKDITLYEPDPDCKGGNVHHEGLTLYAVWAPLHAYGIKYHLNAPSYYDCQFDFTIPEGGEGSYAATESYWRTAFMPVTEGKFEVEAGTMKANVIRLKNKVFMGWATSAEDAAAGIVNPKYELDENGCFKNKLTFEEATPCTKGNEIHYLDLYAVLKPAHYLQIKFEKGIADSIDIRERNVGITKIMSNLSDELLKSETSYTWPGDTIYAYASKSGYKWIGWSPDPDATDPLYTTKSHKIIQEITGTITGHDPSTCPDNEVHTVLTLYPVFERDYSLTYNANGGTGAPAKQSVTVRKPDLTGSYVFDIYDDVTNNKPPKRNKFQFMGWSTTKTGFAEYGYPYPIELNYELHRQTANLKPVIEATDANPHLTLYAVWWRSYKFMFDANGGTGAPADTYKYSTAETDTIRVPKDVPTKEENGIVYEFLGWSTEKDATYPMYVIPADSTPDNMLQSTEKISLKSGNDGYAEIKLYAVWREKAGG